MPYYPTLPGVYVKGAVAFLCTPHYGNCFDLYFNSFGPMNILSQQQRGAAPSF